VLRLAFVAPRAGCSDRCRLSFAGPDPARGCRRSATLKASAASCRITPVTSNQWKERDRERRETVERYHRLKDFEEDFVVAKQAAKTREERGRGS